MHKRLIKKSAKYICIAAGGIVVFSLIWVNLPLDKIEVSKLPFYEKDISVYFDLSSNIQKIYDFSDNLKFSRRQLIKRNFKNVLIVKGIKLCSPLKITACLEAGKGEIENSYCLVIKGKKFVRLTQLCFLCLKKALLGENKRSIFLGKSIYVRKTLDDLNRINALAIWGDCIILANKPAMIEEIFDGLNSRHEKTVSALISGFEDYKKNAVFFINNQKGQFSEQVRLLEEKSFYSFFSKIEDLEYSVVYADFISGDLLKGKAYFVFENLEAVSLGKKDINFFAKIIHRFFTANKVDFKIDYFQEDLRLTVDYKAQKL